MTTATGIISWQAQASAFGDTKIDMQIASTRLAAENNHRFPGQYYDAETGLHQNYFRDYEASIGRYVQRDPIGLDGGINVFGYVGGGPVGGVDETGLAGFFGGEISGPISATGFIRVTCTDECGNKRHFNYVKICVGSSLGAQVVGEGVANMDGESCRSEHYAEFFIEGSASAPGAGSAGFDIGLTDTNPHGIGIPNGLSGVVEGGMGAGIGGGIQLCYYIPL